MSKKVIFSILAILIICIGIYFYNSKDKINNPINHKELLHTIDSLNYKIDSLSLHRETLILKIDSSKNNIKVIEHWYEKEYNTILVQPTDSDCVFFSEYLSTYFK